MSATHQRTTCCIVGGGPAGMMLGYLLARQGIDITVLEKHKDFFRDFRGDTVHPSTLELFHELGLLDDFLKVPHQQLRTVDGVFGDYSFTIADFSRVPAHCKFVALMPQWDFLDFLSSRAQAFPNFRLLMEHEATNVYVDQDGVRGVEVQTPGGPSRIEADLVVACDGRHSVIRKAAKLPLWEFGVPIDVLWFRISRERDDPEQLLGNINYGRALVLINRESYFQAGLIIRKGSFEEMESAGLAAFRETIRRIAPYLGERVNEVDSWDQVKLLTVQLNRLRDWHRPGLLCIGDAAHAMSPAGGVGINLAIQDAVAAANLLATPLRDGRAGDEVLARVQQRREFPTRVTQFLQKNAHRGLSKIFENPNEAHAPWILRAITSLRALHYLFGRLVGIGVRPEHIQDIVPTRVVRPGPAVQAAAVVFGVAVAGAFLFRRRSATQVQ